jgi:transposase
MRVVKSWRRGGWRRDENPNKDDRVDALYLARLARLEPALLSPVQHRAANTQEDLALLRSRDALVSARTELINHVRGLVKSVGGRLPTCSEQDGQLTRDGDDRSLAGVHAATGCNLFAETTQVTVGPNRSRRCGGE